MGETNIGENCARYFSEMFVVPPELIDLNLNFEYN